MNERIVEYVKKLNKRLVDDLIDDIGDVLLETKDVDAYKAKLDDIATIVVTQMIKNKVDEVKEDIRKKYGIVNPQVTLTPKMNSVLQYMVINDNVNDITEDEANEEDDGFITGIPQDLYQDMYDRFRDVALKIKTAILPEMRDNVLTLKETVSKMMGEDTVNIEDVILPSTNLYTVMEDRGLIELTGASSNNKDLNLLNGTLPTDLLDYDKVISELPMTDLKVLYEEYRKEFMGWDHIDEEINEILDNGMVAIVANNVYRKIKVFELPITVTLLLMFKSIIDNNKKYGLDPSTLFGVKVIYDLLVNRYKLNMNLYKLRVSRKQPIYGIEGTDHPVVYLIEELLEDYDVNVLNAYALMKFEDAKAKSKTNLVVISQIDDIKDIINNRDKYLNYVVTYSKLKAAKKMNEVKIGLANAYALQLSNNSPKLIDYISKETNTTGYEIKKNLFDVAKYDIMHDVVDPMEVSKAVMDIIYTLPYYTDLNRYIKTVRSYSKLLDDNTVDLLTVLGVIGIITDHLLDSIAVMRNGSVK